MLVYLLQVCFLICFFFVKHKTADEMRISDWSSDVCSSDLLIGTPRHLSQHPGGFVLTQERLDDLVPIEPARMEDRQIIEWDKDDIDVLKFMKVDVLGLGMLGCMNRAFNLLKRSEERRVGKGGVRTVRSRGATDH